MTCLKYYLFSSPQHRISLSFEHYNISGQNFPFPQVSTGYFPISSVKSDKVKKPYATEVFQKCNEALAGCKAWGEEHGEGYRKTDPSGVITQQN